jgi:hypothetical protein
MTDMTDFDAELKRAFALSPEPADDAFVERVGAAVGRRERRRRFGLGVQLGAMAVGGGAGAFGMSQALQAILPQIQASLGPDLLLAMTAQAPVLGLGAPMMMVLTVCAGAAGAWVAREATA